MRQESGTYCPLIKKTCLQFKCAFWTKLYGTHPQTGQQIDEWDCAVKWLPTLLIEGAKETRQTAAAVESFRNEMVVQGRTVLALEQNEGTTLRRLNHENKDRS